PGGDAIPLRRHSLCRGLQGQSRLWARQSLPQPRQKGARLVTRRSSQKLARGSKVLLIRLVTRRSSQKLARGSKVLLLRRNAEPISPNGSFLDQVATDAYQTFVVSVC